MTAHLSFRESLKDSSPNTDYSLPLQALWWESKGNWEKAHDLSQQANSKEGDWVHAYLHRAEGDLTNAAYWYDRAGQPSPSQTLTLEQERGLLITALLNSNH